MRVRKPPPVLLGEPNTYFRDWIFAHTKRRATRVAPFRTFEREQQANHVGLQAHSRRHESSRVILLSSYYLQVVVEVCHQLLVSSLADIPAVGSENWQNSAFPVFVGLY